MNLPPFWYQFSGSRLWVALHFASSGETTPRYVCVAPSSGQSPRARRNQTQIDVSATQTTYRSVGTAAHFVPPVEP